MNLTSHKIGRGKFAFIYFGALGLKILTLFILTVIFVAIKASPSYFFIALPASWLLIHLCLLPSFAARLNDVELSLYCLFLIYGGDFYLPALFPLMPHKNTAEQFSSWLLQPFHLFLLGIFSLIWFISIVLWFYLFLKKGENNATIS